MSDLESTSPEIGAERRQLHVVSNEPNGNLPIETGGFSFAEPASPMLWTSNYQDRMYFARKALREGLPMDHYLRVAPSAEDLTSPAEQANGITIYEAYDTPEGTHLRRGFVKICGAKVYFTDEAPIGAEDPEPFILIPGFGGIKPGYSMIRHELALAGRRAISYKPPREQDLTAAFSIKHLFTPEKLTSKAGYAMLRRVVGEPEVRGAHLIGHSMGGPIASDIAVHKPEHVLSVTVIGSAGAEDHNVFTMARRLPGFARHELIPNLPRLYQDYEAGVIAHVLEYALRNPRLTIGEIRQVTSVNARPLFRRLGDLGIKTVGIFMYDDHLFYERNVRRESAPLLDQYIPLPGNHLWPQLESEDAAETIIDAQAA